MIKKCFAGRFFDRIGKMNTQVVILKLFISWRANTQNSRIINEFTFFSHFYKIKSDTSLCDCCAKSLELMGLNSRFLSSFSHFLKICIFIYVSQIALKDMAVS